MEKLDISVAKNKEELMACLRIRREVFQIEKKVPKEIEEDEFDCLDKECEHFLIRYDNRNVGTTRCRVMTDKKVIRLQRFCFLAEFRNLGLGRKALEFIEQYYRSMGKDKIVMDAKFEVSIFYEKCGYLTKSDIFEEVGIEHIAMEKYLLQ